MDGLEKGEKGECFIINCIWAKLSEGRTGMAYLDGNGILHDAEDNKLYTTSSEHGTEGMKNDPALPVCSLRLSELRHTGSENDPLPSLAEIPTVLLEELAEEFFDGQEKVLQKPSPELHEDKLSAIRLLLQFMGAMDHPSLEGGAFVPQTHDINTYDLRLSEKNILLMELESESHLYNDCYDGGCGGGTWEEYIYAKLERLPLDECLPRASHALSDIKVYGVPSYRGAFPEEHCECLITTVYRREDNTLRLTSLYLLDPFGLQGTFRFSFLYR